jgi:monoamine oxidase
MAPFHRRRFLLAAIAGLSAAACGPPPPPLPPPTTDPGPGGERPRRVVVVGAGISGLVVATDLVKKGLDVTVLEAQSRPGGRILTVREPFRDGLYVEAGATHVLADPDLLAVIEESGAKTMSPPRRPGLSHPVFWKGERKVLAPGEEPPSENVLSPEEQKLGEGWHEKFLGASAKIDPLKEEWLAGKLTEYDGVSLAEYLRSLGASQGLVIEVQAMLSAADGPEEVSALHILREWANIHRERGLVGPGGRIVGGTDNIPRGLAAKLGERVIYRAVVKRIEQDAGGVTAVIERKGAIERITGDRLVCTVPFTVLKGIEVAPAFSEAKRRAIESLHMACVARVWAMADRRFWAERGESGHATTDLPIGDVRDETVAQEGTAGVLGVYASGKRARALTALPEKERMALVLSGMDKAHPGMKERVIATASKCWDEDPYARGAYAWFAPGQMTGLGTSLFSPEGRVHFAGEHTSYRPGFMHGAVASAKRVVREIAAVAPPEPPR